LRVHCFGVAEVLGIEVGTIIISPMMIDRGAGAVFRINWIAPIVPAATIAAPIEAIVASARLRDV
jgi:hypothetical protein